MTRIPPQSLDSEKALLSSILQDEDAVDVALGIVDEQMMSSNAHRLILRAVKELSGSSSPINMLSVLERLTTKKQIDEVGGASYISDVANRVPTGKNVKYFAEVVRDKYIKRLVIKNSNKLIDMAYSEDDGLETEILKFQDQVLSVDAEYNYDFDMPRLLSDEVSVGVPIKTGFNEFDRAFGGFYKKSLSVIAGRPSQGKSALALSFMLSMIKQNTPCAFMSLEMDEATVKNRLISMESGIDHQIIKHGSITGDIFKKYSTAYRNLVSMPLFTNTKPRWNIDSMSIKIKKLHKEGKCEVAFVDYLTYMEVSGSKERYSLKVGEITTKLKSLAKELDIAIILLAQLSRKPDDRDDHRPRPSDLGESGKIEQDADMIIFPYRNYMYSLDEGEKEKAELIMAKNRNGAIGRLENYRYIPHNVLFKEEPIFDLERE